MQLLNGLNEKQHMSPRARAGRPTERYEEYVRIEVLDDPRRRLIQIELILSIDARNLHVDLP